LIDQDKDGIPDGYFLGLGGNEATYPNREIIRDSNNYNIYHVWQKNGKGWFATYFKVGRVPPNTSFRLSLDSKMVSTKGVIQAMLYTDRLSDGQWGSGQSYSKTGSLENKDSEWKTEFHTIKTKDQPDIMLSGWIAAWS
jgi:hypothetical protein